MFATIAGLIPQDRDLPARAWRIDCLTRVLDGTIYDALPHEFHEERGSGGEYVPLRQRKPSVRYNVCRIVAEDAAGLLFGEGRFPAVQCEDEATRQAIAELIRESRLADAMNEAALRGSVGSVVVMLRVLKARVFWSVMPTTFLTPAFDPEAPDTLATLKEKRKVSGRDLRDLGYDIADGDRDATFWFQRIWDGQAETWFVPWKVKDEAPPVEDAARSVRHALGFCPAVWIVNLPGGEAPDGWATFRPAIETMVEIDYQLSQAGRGLKYSSDPTLLIKEPAAMDGEIIKGGGNALVVSEKGDAKLLEIGGTAAAAVIEYVRALREFALESIHGNRTSPEKMSSAQSGRAMEMMYAPLIGLADKLRASYGEAGLLRLLRMVVRAAAKYPVEVAGKRVTLADAPLSLVWQPWFAPTEADKVEQAQALSTLVGAGLMSAETGTAAIAETYDIEDVQAERGKVEADQKAAEDREMRAAEAAAKLKTKPTD